jgi:Kef-type K+ transport system membrane component KefB
MIWFQTNGQFVWPWFKRNPVLIALIGGSTISYMFIIATKYVAEYYDGQLWPGRFIGFAMGMVSFGILTYFIMDEPLNQKTIISLSLSVLLICVQLFWK